MSEFINIVGIQFKYKDFMLYCDWLLLLGLAFIVYAAYCTGMAREKKERRIAEKRDAPKEERDDRISTTTPIEKQPALIRKRSATPSKREKATTPTTPATTPKKRSARKKAGEEDLGHIISPEGRRSMRIKTKVDEADE